MQGQFPKYNQLIPQTFQKEAKVNKSDLISALERVAVMVSEKNSIVKFNYELRIVKYEFFCVIFAYICDSIKTKQLWQKLNV